MKSSLKFFVILLILLVANSSIEAAGGEQFVQDAWQYWLGNDQAAAEENFKAALAADSTETRAHLGLAFLYSLQKKDEAAWQSYQKVLQYGENPYPYIFAGWSAIGVMNSLDGQYPVVAEFWKKLSESADEEGILKAMANQFLGQYYERRGELEKSREHYKSINAIKEWTVIGPFDNISASGFDKVFPPETEYKFEKTYEGKNGIPAKWFKLAQVRPDYWIDFMRYLAFDQSIFYANNFVYSSRKQTAQIRIGTSGSLKAFLNDEALIEYFDENNNDLDTYIVETELQKGWNRFLVKVGYSEIERCNFMARITDATGDPIEGLKISTEPQNYPKKPGAPAEMKPLFAETYFQEQIADHPDHYENYLLLADCYLRNDKAIEGELVLRKAIEGVPEAAMLYLHIIEAYARGEKYDEIATAMEKIYSLDPNVPDVIAYKFNRYLENQQLDKAEEMLQRLATLIPETEEIYQYYISFYSAKRQVEKIIEASKKGYEKFPYNWVITSTEASISVQTSRVYGRAVELYQDFLSRNYTANALTTLADTYLKASAVDLWEQTYRKLFGLDSSGTGYYYTMGNTYFSLQRYEDAEKYLLKAIEICPNSSGYWEKLGETYRASGAANKARQAYKEALKYNHANYEAREKLRELDGKKSIFLQFESANIDSLMGDSSVWDWNMENGAVILLHDLKRVVYEQGTSESMEEMLIKVFNKRGIDDFKEYWISYNGYTEGLAVEKAVVIKQDGAEINADVNQNHVVFKSLEENNFIYLRWRIKNYYTGKLSNHFWDQFYFNGFTPIKDIRYAVSVPEDFEFHYRTQNTPDKAVKKNAEEGVIYQWRLTDEPAIEYEYGMPILDDVGKILYISSIDNWEYMVEWYADIASTKTRSSYEIKEQVEKLFQEKPHAGEEEKIKTVYNFITENIRYSSVPFRQSGLIPQEARDVLVTKIGDCKDVSTLCIAMLNEVGIDAHYVLVNTRDEGSNENALPSIVFNHCIAGVETSGGIRYLDLTGSNFPYGSIPEMDLNGFSLMIKPGTREPSRLKRENFLLRNILREMIVKIHPDNSVELEKTGIKTGSLAASMRNFYRDQARSAIEKNLVETLSDEYPGLKLLSFEINNLNEINTPIHYTYRYLAPDYVSEVGSFKFLKIPWTDRLKNDKALSYEVREYLYNYWPGVDTLREEVEILTPAGYEPLELGENVYLTCSVADYSLTFSLDGDIIRGVRELIYKKAVVSPEEYPDFRTFYNRALKADNRQILLKAVERNQ
jgi:tetratricopeptide (TPR) repeat protein